MFMIVAGFRDESSRMAGRRLVLDFEVFLKMLRRTSGERLSPAQLALWYLMSYVYLFVESAVEARGSKGGLNRPRLLKFTSTRALDASASLQSWTVLSWPDLGLGRPELGCLASRPRSTLCCSPAVFEDILFREWFHRWLRVLQGHPGLHEAVH